MSSKISVDWDDAKEFIVWVKGKSFCNSGQHICDRLANHFEETINLIVNTPEPHQHQDFGGF